MMPIHELLSRIRWDAVFGDAAFELGYFDRVEQRVLRLAFKEVYFDEHDQGPLQFVDEEGVTHRVPLHRIRDVYRNGERIWHRHRPPAGT